MDFFTKAWVLTKKDLLLIARRRWISTLIRALIFPIVLTAIIASVKNWISSGDGHGIGTPSPILSLQDAFTAESDGRKTLAIIDRGLTGNDVRGVINSLVRIAQDGGRDVQVLSDASQLTTACPASSKGYTSCFGAVDFWSAPSVGPNAIWNYTLYQDSILGGANIYSTTNGAQIYTLPLQHTIDSLIAQTTGDTLPTVLQYPFTSQSQTTVDFLDAKFYAFLVTYAVAFALFLALAGIAYHLTGHVVRHREEGMLQLIDAQMPNRSRWESLFLRMLATHVAFDLVYAPAWIVSGAVAGKIIFTYSNPGWFVLIYLLCGLAMTSFSILASSLFRRVQLSSISATVAAVALALVAQFVLSGQTPDSYAGNIATGLLFPPAAFVYLMDSAAYYEVFSQPFDPSQVPTSPLSALAELYLWDITAATFLGFFVFQIVVYPLLAIVIERFLWGSSFRGRRFNNSEEMSGCAVRLRGFTKRYSNAAKKKNRTLAVDDLSLDLQTGSITALLGANGSGKSTTLNCIGGLQSLTEGTIEIDGRGGLGLCPQKNVMWGEMTVEAHVSFFQRLKNPSLDRKASDAEVSRLIEGCDLNHKTHAKAKTLSGGQQRKLQMAMMLAGGSKVCCIDEASSGIDPLARRKIWDILMTERGRRTMLLTTHFLDEAEVLADHIAILSSGRLLAEGSVSSLKNTLGGGFQVIIPGAVPDDLGSGLAVPKKRLGDDTVFILPDGERLARFLEQLEKQDIVDFRIEGPTIEKVFLDLAEEMKPSHHKDESTSGGSSANSIDFTKAMSLHTPAKPISGFKQTGVLLRKRLTILKRNPMAYIAALFLPLLVAGLVTRFFGSNLNGSSGSGLLCRASTSPSIRSYRGSGTPLTLTTYESRQIVLGPPNIASADRVIALLPNRTTSYGQSYTSSSLARWSRSVTQVNSRDEFFARINSDVSGYQSNVLQSFFGSGDNAPKGGIFLDDQPVIAWNSDVDEPGLFLNTLTDTLLLGQSIAVNHQFFARSFAPRDFLQSLIAVITTLGFAVYPAAFALYPTAERLRRVRAMQYSNGIKSGPLWSAYAIFDFIFLLVIAICVTAIWGALYRYWYGLGYLFVVFVFYGAAAVALSYVISLFVKSQLAAVAVTAIVNVLVAMLFFVGNFLTVDSAPVNLIYRNLNIIYFTIALISPAVSLLRALMVTLNVYGLACRGQQYASYPGEITLFGGPILYLIVQFILLVMFLIWYESGRSLEVFGLRIGSKKTAVADQEKELDIGGDATEESRRLASTNHGLRVQYVSKTFGKNKAVDNVSFGILPGEKFALLGPNGAGKSTSISLIRGELAPDSTDPAGSVHIAGDSLMQTPMAAKHHLGVCPQFDAVDSMTLSEHLHFYARSRGLSKQERIENIHEIITRLNLTPHANKMVKNLSGGTKRKLSLGIALVANPSVLLLDEPSSGMDASAKRALWSTLDSISAGRSLLITTHSMEEADHLCDRAGIMASRMLALGTIPSLHAQHGDKIYVHIVEAHAPRSGEQSMLALMGWAQRTFAIADRETPVNGQIRFSVPLRRPEGAHESLLDGSHMGRIFRAIEAQKNQSGWIRDYSVGPATLDQVFLNVVGRHGVEEENSRPEIGRKRGGQGWVSKIFQKSGLRNA